MKTAKLTIIGLAAMLAMTACDAPKTPQQSQQAPAQPKAPQRLVIKGFYIGMSAEELLRTIKEVHKLPASQFSYKPQDHWATIYLGGRADEEINIRLNSDNKVFHINMGNLAVNTFFNAQQLNLDEFIQSFVNAYHIPEMAPRTLPDSNQRVHEYISPDGVRVDIFSDKSILIQKADVQGMKGNFN